MNDEEKKEGLEIIEEDAFEPTDEELEQDRLNSEAEKQEAETAVDEKPDDEE